MFILRNAKAPNQGSEVKYYGGFDVIDSILHSSEYLDQIQHYCDLQHFRRANLWFLLAFKYYKDFEKPNDPNYFI